MIFSCYPSRKHARYGHCWHKHNAAYPTLKFVTQFEINSKHSKRRSGEVFYMSLTSFTQAHQWKIWSPQRMLRNDVSVNVQSSMKRTRSLQQWVLAHDASSSISILNSEERYGILKSDEFLSYVKFHVWFGDSLVQHMLDTFYIKPCESCRPCVRFRITDPQEDLFRGNMAEEEPDDALVSFCLCDGSEDCGVRAVADTTASGSEPRNMVRLGVPTTPIRRKRQATDTGDDVSDGNRRTFPYDYKYVYTSCVFLDNWLPDRLLCSLCAACFT